MSERWEESIRRWYGNGRNSNLEYLDLSETIKPSNQELAHNLSIIYNKVCLSSKVHLKNLKVILEKLQDLEVEVAKIKLEVQNLVKKESESIELLNIKLQKIEKSIKILSKSISG